MSLLYTGYIIPKPPIVKQGTFTGRIEKPHLGETSGAYDVKIPVYELSNSLNRDFKFIGNCAKLSAGSEAQTNHLIVFVF